jgi:hypothetical protein
MTNSKSEHELLIDKLIEAGFENGWSITGTELVYWEHDADPPTPLTRPKA